MKSIRMTKPRRNRTQRHRRFALVLILTTATPLWTRTVCARNKSAKHGKDAHLFSTWENMEADKCASAWLIKRFIDRKAAFRFYKHGKLIKKGIAFDTADAKFRRRPMKSTYEMLYDNYKLAKLKDKGLIAIGEIVHDIEVNKWDRKRRKETPAVQKALHIIMKKNRKNPQGCIDQAMHYFDKLYLQLGGKPERLPKKKKARKGKEGVSAKAAENDSRPSGQ